MAALPDCTARCSSERPSSQASCRGWEARAGVSRGTLVADPRQACRHRRHRPACCPAVRAPRLRAAERPRDAACMLRCSCAKPSRRDRAPAAAWPPAASRARCRMPAAAALLLPDWACSTDISRPAVATRPLPTAQNSSLHGGDRDGLLGAATLSQSAGSGSPATAAPTLAGAARTWRPQTPPADTAASQAGPSHSCTRPSWSSRGRGRPPLSASASSSACTAGEDTTSTRAPAGRGGREFRGEAEQALARAAEGRGGTGKGQAAAWRAGLPRGAVKARRWMSRWSRPGRSAASPCLPGCRAASCRRTHCVRAAPALSRLLLQLAG